MNIKSTLICFAFLSIATVGVAQDFSQMPALILKAKESGNIKMADSLTEKYTNNYLFRLKEKDLMTKENLTFICHNIGATTSKGFKFFMKQSARVNAIIGQDKAEYAIRSAITKEYMPDPETWKTITPDWDNIQKKVVAKFGSLGQEVVYSRKMIYYSDVEQWADFGKYYVLYFESAFKRPEYIINNISWMLFLHVNDSATIAFACDIVMKYAMETWYQNDPAAFDTYANLLYKAGRNEIALEWQKRAIKIAKGTPYEQEFRERLEKMLRGEKTWLSS